MGMARLAQTTSTSNYLAEIRLSLSNGSTSWRTIVIRERNGKYIRVGDVLEDLGGHTSLAPEGHRLRAAKPGIAA
jgi:hypothetical protein